MTAQVNSHEGSPLPGVQVNSHEGSPLPGVRGRGPPCLSPSSVWWVWWEDVLPGRPSFLVFSLAISGLRCVDVNSGGLGVRGGAWGGGGGDGGVER